MNKMLKTQRRRRIVITIVLTAILCLVLSLIIFQGQYFQNWLKSDDTTNKLYVGIGWFALFVYYGVCMFYLWQFNSRENNYLFLFSLQFAAFAWNLICVYCLALYIAALISCMLSFALSIYLAVRLYQDKKYIVMLMLALLAMLYLYCIFSDAIYCLLEYGIWKD